MPFQAHKVEGLRYYFENPAYPYSDAILLYCMIRSLKPKRIIEVGSGFSSCVTLDRKKPEKSDPFPVPEGASRSPAVPSYGAGPRRRAHRARRQNHSLLSRATRRLDRASRETPQSGPAYQHQYTPEATRPSQEGHKQIPRCLRQNSRQGKQLYSHCCSLRPRAFSPQILG
jgi:hypothetical protein